MWQVICALTLLCWISTAFGDLPDLTDLPNNLDLAPKTTIDIKVPEAQIEKQTLASLKSQINDMTSLEETKRLRLISVIEELLDKPDQAYLTFKKIPSKDQDLWHSFRELYLSDLLGLEDDTQRLAHLINERLDLKQLKVKKVSFCRSVKGFGIYEPVQGSLNSNSPTIVYVEINHLEQQVHAGQFKSSCRASFDIKDQNGFSVYNFNYPQSFSYEAKSELQDYFIWMKWTPSLAPGNYTMVMSIQDEQSLLKASKELEFEIR